MKNIKLFLIIIMPISRKHFCIHAFIKKIYYEPISIFRNIFINLKVHCHLRKLYYKLNLHLNKVNSKILCNSQ